jgi:hypothetical protein
VLAATELRGRAANALADVRAGVFTDIRTAEEAHGLAPGTVRREFRGLLDSRGQPAATDRAAVIMRVVGENGPEFRVVRGSHARQLVGQHQRDLQQFLASGDTAVLDKWQGKRVTGVVLLSDPAVIEALAAAGHLHGGPYPEARR